MCSDFSSTAISCSIWNIAPALTLVMSCCSIWSFWDISSATVTCFSGAYTRPMPARWKAFQLDILWLYACVTIPECLKPSKIAFQCLCLSVGLCSLAMNVRWWLMLSRFPKVSCSTASSAGMILVRDRACSFHLATFPSACDTTSWQKSILKRFIGFIPMNKSSRVVFKSQNKMFLLL